MEQIELFPRATDDDIALARALLVEYRRCVKRVEVYEKVDLDDLEPSEKRAYDQCKRKINILNRAVELIIDHEIREIMWFRFIEGNSYSNTMLKFTSIMDDRTVDRKLNKGIEAVAESLKIM